MSRTIHTILLMSTQIQRRRWFLHHNIHIPFQILDVDQCVPDPCNGHVCIDREFYYKCHCGNGYSGINCEIPPDFCSTLPCKNGGSCHNENGHYNCSCLGSFKGKNCEIVIRKRKMYSQFFFLCKTVFTMHQSLNCTSVYI